MDTCIICHNAYDPMWDEEGNNLLDINTGICIKCMKKIKSGELKVSQDIMSMIVELIDYEDKYADVLNKIEENQWGIWATGDIRDEITKYTHIKLAKIDNEIVGIGYGKQVGDAFYIQVIVIIPEYQHMHIGSLFMEYFISYATKLNLANIVCEGVLVNNHMNILNIMKKYEFKEVIRIKDYWGFRFPDDWCKECESKPCKCTNVIFVKNIE